MSTSRIARSPTQKKGKGPNGRGFCKWCEKEVPKGRRAWCSDECCDESSIRTDPAFARSRVFERDHGVCVTCGIDTELLKKMADHVQRMFLRVFPGRGIGWSGRRGFLRGLGFTRDPLWECDHIVPVVEGGGECGLENLRTLCVPCHNTQTAQLLSRRATQLRREREASVQLELS